MGFGFSVTPDKKEEEKPKIDYANLLSVQLWPDIDFGMKVKSLLNGAIGYISKIDKSFDRITVSWNNGNISCARKREYSKVVIIRDEE